MKESTAAIWLAIVILLLATFIALALLASDGFGQDKIQQSIEEMQRQSQIMNETYQTQAALKEAFKEWFWRGVGALFVIALMLAANNWIQSFICGMFWKFGRFYNEGDPILFDNEHGRIEDIGWLQTRFHIYKMDSDGRALMGWIVVVDNRKLADHTIKKPLVPHVEPSTLTPIVT